MQITLAYGASLWLALLGHVTDPTKPRPARESSSSSAVRFSDTWSNARADAPAVTGKPRSHYYSSQTNTFTIISILERKY